MPTKAIPFPQNPEQLPHRPALSPADKFAVDMHDLVFLSSTSLRQLRRLDASRDIPGRFQQGRRVLFVTAVVKAWIEAGMPDKRRWEAIQRAKKC
jgi:hypothetical protein